MDSEINHNAGFQEALNTLEIDRKIISKNRKLSNIITGFAFITVVIWLIIKFHILVFLGFFFVYGIIRSVIRIKIENDTQRYKVDYKTNVVIPALKNLKESLAFTPQSGISDDEFISSELFITKPDRYNTQDLITGTADKTSFYFAEVHAEFKIESENKKRTKWFDIFKGIIFIADFNKNFSTSTVVRPKSPKDEINSWFSKNIFSFGDSDKVQLENTEFDSKFVTYSKNQIEARYILTPAMMERIVALNSKCDKTISISFIHSKMYIAFPLSHNYFEAPIHKTLLAPDLLTDDLSIVQFMQDIVHELDLNTRIWGKE
ncbi:DUF3137 domain-containing protein [Flavobacterium chungangense]|uniref:Galanin n=1 Tax=Flavobacterium chungangense TaxID=554283 RepID=A0A6V6YS60_9FLAO|nr:DUF3137 domain-containing protein [Flavobacterium chungangense]CAD0002358.1 galanin [Flavobacterium chungangense]